MSFEEPLEENEEPCEDAYTFSDDGAVRIYHVDSVVEERVHKTFGHQYAVKYKNGEHQWRKASDIEKHVPEMLKIFHDRKNGNGITSGKSEQFPPRKRGRPRKGQNSGNGITSGKPDQRAFKRPSSRDDNNGGSIKMKLKRDGSKNFSVSLGESSHGNSKNGSSRKRWSTTKVNKSMGASTSSQINASNDEGGNGLNKVENLELSTQHTTPDLSNVKAALGIANLEVDPYNTAVHALQIMTKITHDFFGPGSKEKEADKAEIEKLKSSNQELDKEVESLQKQAELEKDEIREAYEKKLKEQEADHSKTKKELEKVRQEKEVVIQENEKKNSELKEKNESLQGNYETINRLDTENKSLKEKHLETLRKIIGEGNYEDTDDEAALIQIAMTRAQWLNQYLAVAKGHLVLADPK